MTIILDVLKPGQGCFKANYENLWRLNHSAMSVSHSCLIRMEAKTTETFMDVFSIISSPTPFISYSFSIFSEKDYDRRKQRRGYFFQYVSCKIAQKNMGGTIVAEEQVFPRLQEKAVLEMIAPWEVVLVGLGERPCTSSWAHPGLGSSGEGWSWTKPQLWLWGAEDISLCSPRENLRK